MANEYGLPEHQLAEIESLARSPALSRFQKQALRAMLDKYDAMLDSIVMLSEKLMEQHQAAQIGPPPPRTRRDERKQWHQRRGEQQ